MVPASRKYVERLIGKNNHFQERMHRVKTFDLSERRARSIIGGRVLEEFKFLNKSCLCSILQSRDPLKCVSSVPMEENQRGVFVLDRGVQKKLLAKMRRESEMGAKRLISKRGKRPAPQKPRKTKVYEG